MEAHTSNTGCRACHCDLEQHMLCLNYVFLYGFHQVLIRSAGHFYFVGARQFCDNLQTHLGALLLGRVLLIETLRYFQLHFCPPLKETEGDIGMSLSICSFIHHAFSCSAEFLLFPGLCLVKQFTHICRKTADKILNLVGQLFEGLPWFHYTPASTKLNKKKKEVKTALQLASGTG